VTAINIIKQKSAVHMLTDGASWLYNGKYYNGPAVTKAWQLSHLQAVVAARGPLGSPGCLADFFGSSGCGSYDELKRCAITLMRTMMSYGSYKWVFEGRHGPKIEVLIAGWSETTGPDAFAISVNTGDPNPALEPWIAHDCGSVTMAPGTPEIEQAALAAMPAHVRCADDMDPVRDGISIMEAQRAALGLTDGPVGMVTCGAFVQLDPRLTAPEQLVGRFIQAPFGAAGI
jgi:hypothetical protein